YILIVCRFFFFSSRRRHTSCLSDWSSDVCSSDLTAFAFFLIGGVLALLMRAELAEPGMQLVSRASYNQLFTMHGSVMIYLAITRSEERRVGKESRLRRLL